jgi:hypothetical protein
MSFYKLVPWSKDLDLTEFYAEAKRRGFTNNESQFAMVERIQREQEWAIWILYYKDKAVGSVAAHSLDCLPNAYRICARTCILTDQLDGPYGNALRTKSVITEHQNPTAQFFIPACIEWAGHDKDLYITTNASEVASQRRVNDIFAPLLEKTGVLSLEHVMEYRGHVQNFWKLNVPVFEAQLDCVPNWSNRPGYARSGY